MGLISLAFQKMLSFSARYLPRPFVRQIIQRLNRLPGYQIASQADIFDVFFAIGKPSHAVKVIFDVGANVGLLTKQFHFYYPEATIFSFEPQSSVFARLEAELSRAPFSQAVANGQIRLFKQGLASASTEVDLHLTAHPDSSSIIPISTERYALAPELYTTVGVERISLTTLDAFVSDQHLSSIDILKIDVEGAYYDVLVGGRIALKNADVVYIEIDFVCKGRKNRDWIDTVTLLHDSGLYLTSLRSGGNGGEVFSMRAAWDFLSKGKLPSAGRTHVIECIFQRL